MRNLLSNVQLLKNVKFSALQNSLNVEQNLILYFMIDRKSSKHQLCAIQGITVAIESCGTEI